MSPRSDKLPFQLGPTPIARVGAQRRLFSDLYHVLLTLSWPSTLGLVLLFYVAVNLVFAFAYTLDPSGIENARPGSFKDAFFFSVQTMATIGYGKLVPHSLLANVLVTIEALIGLLGFAVLTGLLFAKFSRPTARLLFSRVAVITPRDGKPSFMFRVANERSNHVADAELRLIMARDETTLEGESVRRFYDLKLERSRNAIFALSWTAIHPITPDSPLYGKSAADLVAQDTGFIASLVGLDATLSQTVHARYQYGTDNIVWGARFADIISRLPDGSRQVDYRRFHDVVPAPAAAPPSP